MADKKRDMEITESLPFPACTLDSKGKVTSASPHIGEVFLYDGIEGADIFALTGIKKEQLAEAAKNGSSNVIQRNERNFRVVPSFIDGESSAGGLAVYFMEAAVDSDRIRKGTLDQAEWDRIIAAADTLGSAPIMIDDTPGVSILEMKNKCRRLKAERGLDMIVVDYLQLMDFQGRADNRQQEITSLSRGLKQLAREMQCPVLVLSQLSRAPETRTDHRPIMSDLRESGAIEQDADVILMLYRDEVYNPDTENPNVCEVNVAKQRNGPTKTVEVRWQNQFTRFVNKGEVR